MKKPATSDKKIITEDLGTLAKSLKERGYAVARGALTETEVAQLRAAAAACAPDQALRAQYNQASDPHRYEYMLKPYRPPEGIHHAVNGASKKGQRGGGGNGCGGGGGGGGEGDGGGGGGGMEGDGPLFPASVVAMAAALCPDLIPDQSFAIVSEAGSADQPEHTDSVPNEVGRCRLTQSNPP